MSDAVMPADLRDKIEEAIMSGRWVAQGSESPLDVATSMTDAIIAMIAASTPVGGWEDSRGLFERLVSACEKDFMNAATEDDYPGRCDDVESVSTGDNGDSALKFGHIRDARQALNAAPPPPSVSTDKGSRPQEAVPGEQAERAVVAWQPPRWPTKGTRLRFLGQNGYDHELEAALKVLEPGEIYTCVDCRVGDWENSVSLECIDGRFNGVMFEMVAHQPADGCSSNEGAGE